jgi:hypothetical protein
MNNFISTFDELSKLYDSETQLTESVEEPVEEPVEEALDSATQVTTTEEPIKEELVEAVEDDDVIEIEDDEITEEEPEEPAANEPKQIVLECSKCGALVIKGDTDVTPAEDSDLVNVEDACEYCEETAGYKIIGTVIPFESETEASDEDDVVEESVENKEELEEILDFDVPINITANDNNVAIGGIN